MDIVEKIMSLDLAEFRRSFARLADAAEAGAPSVADGADKTLERFVLALDAGKVIVTVQALQPRTLGALVTLPRSRVSIDLTDLPQAQDRDAFLARFDRAFQRGGG